MRNRRLHLWFALVVCVVSAPAYALLPIQHWQTGNGAQVYFVANRDLPMLDVSVDFPAGSAFDTREKSGLAALTQRLLKLGAGGLSEDEIARRMADVGAQLGGRFDSDRAGLSLRTLSSAEEMKEALGLLARILQGPQFPPAVLEREKARIIGAIRESDTKPEGIAGRNFNALIYGDHPYGLRSSGETETVARLTREDLAGFYRRHYTADRAVVAIIGNVSRGEAESIAEQLTGELPRAGAPASLPDVPAIAEAGVPAYEAVPYYTISTGSKVPPDIVRKLNADIDGIVRHPDLTSRWNELGITPLGGSPEAAVKRNVLETAKWSRVIKTAGIRAD